MKQTPKTVIVMPAYNAALTLEKTIADIAEGFRDYIILTDDCRHEQNKGYGANQKTCYETALKLYAKGFIFQINED